MAALSCPSCAAPYDGGHPDALARCAWCGALLAGATGAETLVASPRLDAARARQAVQRALPSSSRSWEAGAASLVFYPFADGGPARSPLRALAGMPSTLTRGWRPSGADLRLASAASETETGGVRVPAATPAPMGARTIFYPFHRIAIRRGESESAVWCDAVDGQVMLPELLDRGDEYMAARAGSESRAAAVAGALAGLFVPLPLSLGPLAVALAVFRAPPRRGGRR